MLCNSCRRIRRDWDPPWTPGGPPIAPLGAGVQVPVSPCRVSPPCMHRCGASILPGLRLLPFAAGEEGMRAGQLRWAEDGGMAMAVIVSSSTGWDERCPSPGWPVQSGRHLQGDLQEWGGRAVLSISYKIRDIFDFWSCSKAIYLIPFLS